MLPMGLKGLENLHTFTHGCSVQEEELRLLLHLPGLDADMVRENQPQ